MKDAMSWRNAVVLASVVLTGCATGPKEPSQFLKPNEPRAKLEFKSYVTGTIIRLAGKKVCPKNMFGLNYPNIPTEQIGEVRSGKYDPLLLEIPTGPEVRFHVTMPNADGLSVLYFHIPVEPGSTYKMNVDATTKNHLFWKVIGNFNLSVTKDGMPVPITKVEEPYPCTGLLTGK